MVWYLCIYPIQILNYYYFIKDGYVTSSNADTVPDVYPYYPSQDLFFDYRQALVHPKDNVTFCMNPKAPDSLQNFMKCDIIESLDTEATTFYNVAKYELQTSVTPLGWKSLSVYYARGVGYIGFEGILGDRKITKFINYYKIGNKTVGDYMPYYWD